jgi:hypothetical protein
VKRFHTQGALRELLGTDNERALACLCRMPHDHLRLRTYQLEANVDAECA